MTQPECNVPSRRPPTMTHDTLKKIMWLYRTRTCPLNKRGQCNFGLVCFDSHEAQPERRAPKQNEYNDWHPSTMKCTSNDDESCKYGRACYFAHNDFEVNYHPTVYKSLPCPQFEKDGVCSLGMICPYYHFPQEQRKVDKESLKPDCKSDGVSRKAPPPQEFRRWLEDVIKANALLLTNAYASSSKPLHHIANGAASHDAVMHTRSVSPAEPVSSNGHSHQHMHHHQGDHRQQIAEPHTQNEVEIQLPSSQSPVSGAAPHLGNHAQSQSAYLSNGRSQPQLHAQSSMSPCSPHLVTSLEHEAATSRAASVRSNQSHQSVKSTRSIHSAKSSKSPLKSIAHDSNGKKKKRTKTKEKRKGSRKSVSSKEKEKLALDIIGNYKVRQCRKNKCSDPHCVHFHSVQDRRRSPFECEYLGEPCPRIFDIKTRKFTEKAFACPANDACEYAHNYLELWYHPQHFHTKMCPLLRYQKACPWGFNCTHYHKKSHKRRVTLNTLAAVANGSGVIQPAKDTAEAQQEQTQQRQMYTAPPNLTAVTSSPYSVSSISPQAGHLAQHASQINGTQLQQPTLQKPAQPQTQQQPQGTVPNETTYSYNPLMQGIAPSIHSWRQKMDKTVGY